METQVRSMKVKKRIVHISLVFLHPLIVFGVLLAEPLAILLLR